MSITGNRAGGLVTGLDTEALVKAMATNTKNRLNKQQQKLDKLSWQQTSYRDIISKFSTFKNNFFSASNSATCLKLPSLFSNFSATSNNSKITATASSSSSVSSYSISSIEQLASAAKLNSASGITSGAKIDLSGLDGSNEYSVNVSLDGLSKDITFSTEEEFTAALESNFGAGFTYADGNLSYTSADDISHTYTIQGAKTTFKGLSSSERIAKQTEGLKAIGIEGDGASNKARLLSKLSELNLNTDLVGNNFSFDINGESFSFSKDSTIKDIINTVNDSDAGVKMSFDTLSQTFTVASKDEGANSSVSMKQTGGNLLTALGFGVSAGGVSSTSFKNDGISGQLDTANLNSLKGATYKLSVNGVDAEVFVPTADSNGEIYNFVDDEDMSASGAKSAGEKFADALNQIVSTSKLKGEGSFAFDKTSGKLSFKGTDGSSDTVSIKSTGTEKSDALVSAMNLTADTNEMSGSSLAKDVFGGTGTFYVGGVEIAISEPTTMEDIKQALESADVGTLNLDTGVISAKAAITASGSENEAFASKVFGEDYAVLSDSSNYPTGDTNTVSSKGQNAIVTVNGVKISNASNTISVDGTSIFIGNLTDAEAAAVSDENAITVSTTRDTSKALNAVVNFVNQYNSLIADIGKELSTTRPKSNGSYYEPLTEEQKEDMSDKEIEEWEEKAKTGLLYQDATVSSVLSKLRRALSATTSSGLSLEDIGITESTKWEDNGKLEIDEEKLKLALENNSEDITELFTDTNSGLAAKVDNVLDSAISTSRTKGYGSLTLLAGIEGTSTVKDNMISKQLESYQSIIDSLKERYQKELDRYWDRFTALESYTSKYSSVSSMFTTA